MRCVQNTDLHHSLANHEVVYRPPLHPAVPLAILALDRVPGERNLLEGGASVTAQLPVASHYPVSSSQKEIVLDPSRPCQVRDADTDSSD